MCNTYIGLNLTRGKQMKQVLRVGVMNNFDMTEKEFNALKEYERDDRIIFVNSNSFTEIKPNYPSFVTLNPYLKFQEPKGDLSNVKAFRIKMWFTEDLDWDYHIAKSIAFAIGNKIPILITFMRFRTEKSLNQYKAIKSYYVWDHGWWRPRKEYKEAVRDYFKDNVYYCDFDGTGCPSCMNCVKLIVPKDDYDYYSIASLDLKESGNDGVCKYNCPDCFAKKCLNRTKNKKPALNQIKYNRKQLGKMIHV